MAINFPTNPTVGSDYSYQGIKYTYQADGYWAVTTVGTQGVASPEDLNAGTDSVKYLTPTSFSGSKYDITISNFGSASQKDVGTAPNEVPTNSDLGTAAVRDVGTGTGNVMEVGAFGLGKQAITETIDMNLMTTPGFYGLSGSSANSPHGSGTVLLVQAYNGSRVVQTVSAVDSNRVWSRSSVGGVTWTPWVEMCHTGNIRTSTGTSTEFPMSQKAVTDELNTKADKSGGVFTSDIHVNGNFLIGRGGGDVATNTGYGVNALLSNTSGISNTASGYNALGKNTMGSSNTANGLNSLRFNTSGNFNTGDGRDALSANTTFSYCSGIGYNAQVTGSNQVQLGGSGTTTYSYGAVQDRSDIRDKADVRDTALGLDFINALRPVDFRWDMREDYRLDMPEKSEGESDEAFKSRMDDWLESVKLGNIEHDGTHKRSRYHHGLIAQEVKSVIDNSGIDFGGFQDHKLSGGDDVLSLGYEELIAPLIKAVQELAARIDTLESKE